MISTLKKYVLKIKYLPHVRLKIGLTILNAMGLVLMTVFLQYITVIRFDEMAFYKWFAVVKHNILQIDAKPLRDSVIFIDVSKDPELVSDTFPEYGQTVITDRKLLTRFFAKLSANQRRFKYLLCDISFDYPSPEDSAIGKAISGIKNIIVAASMKDDHINKPRFDVPYGCVDYTLNAGAFVKLQVFCTGDEKTLPVYMTERLSEKRFEKKNGLVYENGELAWNTFIPELYYRNTDINTEAYSHQPANHFHLGELMMDSGFFQHYLLNRYIVIGDFYNDKHKTYLGGIPGSAILLNAFLTLKDHSLAISFKWLLFLFFIFLIISYRIFIHQGMHFEVIQKKITAKLLQGFVKKYISYVGILIVLNLISYLIFGLLFSLFYIATYFSLLQTFIEKRKRLIAARSLSKFIKEELI